MSLHTSIHRDITGVVWYEQSLTLKVVQRMGAGHLMICKFNFLS